MIFKRTNYFMKLVNLIGEKRFVRRSAIMEARTGGAKPQRPTGLRALVVKARTIEKNTKVVN